MTIDNSVAVVGTLVVTLAFLVLGAELLRPKGLVPEEDGVAECSVGCGRHLGRVGFWFMVLAVFMGFWDTVLSDQDGFGRMLPTAYGRSRRRWVAWAVALPPVPEERLRRVLVVVPFDRAPDPPVPGAG